MPKIDRAVTLIGAGIVNLITALFLKMNNYDVRVIEKSRDPRLTKLNSSNFGCTLGGLDARMHTLTESDNYNEKGSLVYSEMKDVFSSLIDNSGWSAVNKTSHNIDKFVNHFASVHPKDATRFSDDIYTLTTESYSLWHAMMEENEEIFNGTNINHGVYRTYVNRKQLEEASKTQQKYGMLIREVNGAEISKMIPGASEKRIDLCGALHIKGFTLQVHQLYANLVRFLEQNGVSFNWNVEITRIDEAGSYVLASSGDKFHSKHFVVSVGAYSNHLLSDYRSGKINHGVIGIWKTLPQPNDEFKLSLKIKTPGHTLEDVNVTPIVDNGLPKLILGGGYAYIGEFSEDKSQWSQSALDILYGAMDNLAESYFPTHFDLSRKRNARHEARFCIRSWTPTGLGLFEVLDLKRGKLIITGGHNTGGFALAPSVGKAVCEELEGCVPFMKKAYESGY